MKISMGTCRIYSVMEFLSHTSVDTMHTNSYIPLPFYQLLDFGFNIGVLLCSSFVLRK